MKNGQSIIISLLNK